MPTIDHSRITQDDGGCRRRTKVSISSSALQRSSLVRCGNGLLVAFGLVLSASAQTSPDQILLKDYKPSSLFKIPQTRVEKARHPVIALRLLSATGASVSPSGPGE